MSTPTDDDIKWMKLAIEVSRQCPPSQGAYSVGAILVDEDGQEIARGYSRETDVSVHAEESALTKLGLGDSRLKRATIYSTLEPCSQRKSRPTSCTQHILKAGIPRIVMGWREPSLFVADAAVTSAGYLRLVAVRRLRLVVGLAVRELGAVRISLRSVVGVLRCRRWPASAGEGILSRSSLRSPSERCMAPNPIAPTSRSPIRRIGRKVFMASMIPARVVTCQVGRVSPPAACPEVTGRPWEGGPRSAGPERGDSEEALAGRGRRSG